MVQMDRVKNETAKYALALLKRIEDEIIASQSSGLAVGFLDFDANRISGELDKVKEVIKNVKPADFPETHPRSYLRLNEQ